MMSKSELASVALRDVNSATHGKTLAVEKKSTLNLVITQIVSVLYRIAMDQAYY